MRSCIAMQHPTPRSIQISLAVSKSTGLIPGVHWFSGIDEENSMELITLTLIEPSDFAMLVVPSCSEKGNIKP